ISVAVGRARDVLPRPGRPLKRTWSSASLRLRAALMAIWRLATAFLWPMNSSNDPGRRESSNLTSRSYGLAPGMAGLYQGGRVRVRVYFAGGAAGSGFFSAFGASGAFLVAE